VEYHGNLYFLSCSFDEGIDDYPEVYTVYRLPSDARQWIEKVSDWSDLPGKGVTVGQVRVADVRFDDTKRTAIEESVFNLLGIGVDE
jgi:hypothetical protein